MKSAKKILQWIILAELVFAGVVAYSFFAPLPGKAEIKIVQSGSMEPSLPVGSVVAIVPRASYAVGDIITFGSDTKSKIPTTHRILSIEREDGSVRYVTKGDANEERDNNLVSHSEVIGGVVATVPRLGYMIDFARSKNGFTFMVVIPALLIMLDEIINIVMIMKGTQRRKDPVISKNAEHRKEAIARVSQGLPREEQGTRSASLEGYSVILRKLQT